MTAKKASTPKSTDSKGPAAPKGRKAAAAGVGDQTRDAFRQALDAKNAEAAERSGEDHLNASGMSLHPSDKQQRTHRRKSG